MNDAILAAMIVGGLPIAYSIVVYFVRRKSTKKQEVLLANSDAIKPYRESFEGAMKINAELREALRVEIQRLHERDAEKERRITELEHEVDGLRATENALRALLRQHNVELPGDGSIPAP